MEAVLREEIQTTEFYEFLEQTEIKCETDYEGSNLFKWIRILVRFFFSLVTRKFVIVLEESWRPLG